MSSILSSLTELPQRSLEAAIGFALGAAAADSLGPLSTTLRQEAYAADPSHALSPGDAARIVSQALRDIGWGASEAAASGINSEKFALLEQADLRAPTAGELLQLIRRSRVTDSEITHALRKAQLEPEWDDRIRELATVALTPEQVATAIHRNIMRGEGLIVTQAPTDAGRVPQVPPSTIDPVTQAAWYGYDAEKLRVLVGITGLPLALGEMLQLLNRGEVTENDVKRAVAQSNIRNEYMDVALGLRRHLLTAREYAEAELRGVMPHDAAQAGAALSGLEAADYVTLFETVGRPLNVHAITTGLARGGTYGGTYNDVPEPYRDAIRRSNIRPEYAVLAHANRYTYPSAFVIRTFATSGEWAEERTRQTLLDIGWPPDIVDDTVKAWYGGTAAKADPHVSKAETQVWNTVHKAYVDSRLDDAGASTALGRIGVVPASVPQVLALWQVERGIERAGLSAADIRKTAGLPGWTDQERIDRLVQLGYSVADAQTYLAE